MQEYGTQLRDQGIFVRYQAQQDALNFLGEVLADARGVGLLHGPKSSGKSVVTNQFLRHVQSHVAVAVVNGTRLKTSDLLTRILEQFGYHVALNSVDEMLNMLTVFVVQQTRTYQAPLLILENINSMYPSALGALCKLASLEVNGRYALRVILVSTRDIERIVNSPGMASIAKRVVGNFELRPMSSAEAIRFVYSKLKTAGVDRPDDIFSVEVCEKLHALSGGWPGVLESMTSMVLEQAGQSAVRVDDIIDPNAPVVDQTPKLIVTLSGDGPREVRLTEKRALIGRSDLSDIVIPDQFASNQHALLIRDRNAVVIVDLKSRNGTFVNSRRIQSKVLLHNDIISVGDHRLKMIYAAGHSSIEVENPDLADTAKMKNIADARRLREQNIPTLTVVAKRKK